MLPSQSSPLLMFLGVDESAGNAVFLVDSTPEGGPARAPAGPVRPSAAC